jgi:hypothetical protein
LNAGPAKSPVAGDYLLSAVSGAAMVFPHHITLAILKNRWAGISTNTSRIIGYISLTAARFND